MRMFIAVCALAIVAAPLIGCEEDHHEGRDARPAYHSDQGDHGDYNRGDHSHGDHQDQGYDRGDYDHQ